MAQTPQFGPHHQRPCLAGRNPLAIPCRIFDPPCLEVHYSPWRGSVVGSDFSSAVQRVRCYFHGHLSVDWGMWRVGPDQREVYNDALNWRIDDIVILSVCIALFMAFGLDHSLPLWSNSRNFELVSISDSLRDLLERLRRVKSFLASSSQLYLVSRFLSDVAQDLVPYLYINILQDRIAFPGRAVPWWSDLSINWIPIVGLR